jgi:perosamine synthetase
MKIPFGLPLIGKEEKNIVNKVLSQPILAHGKQTSEFETNFKKFTNANYALSTSSCTAGMHLFYMAVGIKKGDEIILPAQTHVATAHAIEAVGAKPIFVDSILSTGNIDVNKLKNAITKKTKVITVVHYVGIPANMIEVCKIAKKYGLYVLEDCALSLGAKINNIHTGLWGDAGVFSFYPVKHITTGEGGMIISKNSKLKKKIISLKSLGINKNFLDRKTPGLYDCKSFGLNLRMSEINSAIGKIQIKKIPKILKSREENFKYLKSKLESLNENIQVIQNQNKFFISSNYCLIILFKEKKLYSNRQKIIKFLNKVGIGTSIYYPHPVSHMFFYKKKYNINQKLFINAQEISNNSISLPVGPHLNKKKLDYIYNKLKIVIFQLLDNK